MRHISTGIFLICVLTVQGSNVINLYGDSYPSWTQVRNFPVPGSCRSDNDCFKGRASCVRGECHCNAYSSYGDGKRWCEEYLVAKCKWDLQKHCETSPLFDNSHCVWRLASGIEILYCKCNEGHFGRAGVLGCLKAEDDPDGKRPCLADHYCQQLAFCNLQTKRCQCRKGLIGNGVTCRPEPDRIPCKSNRNCPHFSHCKDTTCHCKDELIGNGRTCSRAPRKKCREKKDCHAFARCMNGYCVCEDGAGNGGHCRKRADVCFPTDPCGINNFCAKDRLTGDLWCICLVGVDQDGNCVECFTDQHCARHKARCIDHRCECYHEMYRSESRCTNQGVLPQKCAQDQNCHPKAKCEDGTCICQGRYIGNGEYCRKSSKCAGWLEGSCGSRGTCVIDPYKTHGLDCKCLPGHYYEAPPAACIECQNDAECGVSGSCQYYYCVCKDELIKKGLTKTCLPAPLQKCKSQSDCHEKAKCFLGKCICQNNFTGNGKFCREAQPCSKEQEEHCGIYGACIADPLLPDIPVCRCLKGFKLSKENKCEDVDECKTSRANCKESRCVNTVGSYACTKCREGYIEGLHGECEAIDPCGCGENEECYEGECYCADGYDVDEFGRCFWPDGDSLLVSHATSVRTLCCLWLFLIELLLY